MEKLKKDSNGKYRVICTNSKCGEFYELSKKPRYKKCIVCGGRCVGL